MALLVFPLPNHRACKFNFSSSRAVLQPSLVLGKCLAWDATSHTEQAQTVSAWAKATHYRLQRGKGHHHSHGPAGASGGATHLVMLPMQQEMQGDEIVVTSRWLHVEDKAMDEVL